jgi:hypothetical protein
MRVVSTRQFFVAASLVPLFVPLAAWLLLAALQAAPADSSPRSSDAQGVLGLVAVSGRLSTLPYGLYLAAVWLAWRPRRIAALLAAVAGGTIVPPAVLWIALLLASYRQPAHAAATTPFWVMIAFLVALAYACAIIIAFAVGYQRRWITER